MTLAEEANLQNYYRHESISFALIACLTIAAIADLIWVSGGFKILGVIACLALLLGAIWRLVWDSPKCDYCGAWTWRNEPMGHTPPREDSTQCNRCGASLH